MRNIVTNAILFDMYYMGKSPSTDESGNNTPIIPVSAGTPQFRDFYVDNVVCIGAERALEIRGLPEMSIKSIHLENLIFKTNKGIDITEGQNISLKNVYLDCKDNDPLINIDNSSEVNLNNIRYANAALLFKISGKKSSQIKVSHTDLNKAGSKTIFSAGADENAIKIEK